MQLDARIRTPVRVPSAPLVKCNHRGTQCRGVAILGPFGPLHTINSTMQPDGRTGTPGRVVREVALLGLMMGCPAQDEHVLTLVDLVRKAGRSPVERKAAASLEAIM